MPADPSKTSPGLKNPPQQQSAESLAGPSQQTAGFPSHFRKGVDPSRQYSLDDLLPPLNEHQLAVLYSVLESLPAYMERVARCPSASSVRVPSAPAQSGSHSSRPVFSAEEAAFLMLLYERGLLDAPMQPEGIMEKLFSPVGPAERRKIEQYRLGQTLRVDREIEVYKAGLLKRVGAEVEAELKVPIGELKDRLPVYEANAEKKVLEDLVQIKTDRWFAPVTGVAAKLDGLNLADKDFFFAREQVARFMGMLFDRKKNLDDLPIFPVTKPGSYLSFLHGVFPEPFVLRVQSAHDEIEAVFLRVLDYFVHKRIPNEPSRITPDEVDKVFVEWVPKEKVVSGIELLNSVNGLLLDRLMAVREGFSKNGNEAVLAIRSSLSTECGEYTLEGVSNSTVSSFVKSYTERLCQIRGNPNAPLELNCFVFHKVFGFGTVGNIWDGDRINVEFSYDPSGKYVSQGHKTVNASSIVWVSKSPDLVMEEKKKYPAGSGYDLSWLPKFRLMDPKTIESYVTAIVDRVLASRGLTAQNLDAQFGLLNQFQEFHPHLEAERAFMKEWLDKVRASYEQLYTPTATVAK